MTKDEMKDRIARAEEIQRYTENRCVALEKENAELKAQIEKMTSVEVGKCFGSIQDLIDLLEKVKSEYGNDTPIKIINPIDHNYVGNAKFEGIGKDGSLILSGLFIFGMTDEEIDKRVDKFVEENQEEPMGVFDTDEQVELEMQTTGSYNRGLEDGYSACLLEILKNINVENKVRIDRS